MEKGGRVGGRVSECRCGTLRNTKRRCKFKNKIVEVDDKGLHYHSSGAVHLKQQQ